MISTKITCYLKQFRLGKARVDLKKINVPLLNIVAEEDHLVHPECSVPLNEVVSSEDRRLIRFHTGHVGLIASGIHKITYYQK